MESSVSYKKIGTIVAAVLIAIMLNVEDDSSDTKLVDKQARLPSSEVKTFRFISHLNNLKYLTLLMPPQWIPNLISCEAVDNSPVGIRKHYIQLYQFPLYGQVSVKCMIMGYESSKFISYLCNDWLNTRVEMSIESSSLVPSHPSLVRMKIFSRRRSYFFKYLVSPFPIIYYEAWARQALFTLKYAVEQVRY